MDMEIEKRLVMDKKDVPEMVFQENEIVINATSTTKYTYNDHNIKIEEASSIQKDIENKPTETTYYYNEYCKSEVPYEVSNVKLSPVECSSSNDLKNQLIYQFGVKQEPSDVNNINTNITSAETNSYNNSDKQEIKNEELIIKEEDVDEPVTKSIERENMSWSNDEISQFLRYYEEESIIWNPKEYLHKDRYAVHNAWIRIQKKFSGTCTISQLKKKKESLMGTFRKLHTKVKASKKTGRGADDVFKPDWFAYEHMAKFLQSVYSPKDTQSSEDSEEKYDDQTSLAEELSRNGPTSNANSFQAPASPKGSGSKKRKMRIESNEKRKEEAYKFLKVKRDKPDDNECSLFSNLLCQKLRGLDKNTRDVAMHEIDCIMFRFKQQQYGIRPPGYLQQQVPPFSSETQRFQFTHPSHSQPYSGYPYFPYQPSPESYSEPSSGFPPFLHSHSQPSPGLPPSPQSHSIPSPGFPPSPHSYSQASPGISSPPQSQTHPSLALPPSSYSHSQSSSGAAC